MIRKNNDKVLNFLISCQNCLFPFPKIFQPETRKRKPNANSKHESNHNNCFTFSSYQPKKNNIMLLLHMETFFVLIFQIFQHQFCRNTDTIIHHSMALFIKPVQSSIKYVDGTVIPIILKLTIFQSTVSQKQAVVPINLPHSQ